MQATAEQRNCLDLFNTGESLRVEAAAGSGKTTTLRYLVHRGQLRGRALYTSFGRKNIDEAKRKFPADRIAVRTNHSLAFRGFGSRWQAEGRLVGRLTPGALVEAMGWADRTFSPHANARTGAYAVLSCLDRFMQSADDTIVRRHAMRVLPSHRALSPAEAQAYVSVVVDQARDVWERMMRAGDPMKITHDAYLKAFALGRPQLGFKHICLDEAQDSSDLMIGLLASQESAQLVVVGDRFQQCYAFRGAVNAMDRFETRHVAQLTQSFRFGHAIASMANNVLDQVLDSPMRIRGFSAIESSIEPLDAPRCILARTNASLIGELITTLVDSPGARLGVIGGVNDMEKLVLGAESLMRGERCGVPDLAEFSDWSDVTSASEEDAYKYLVPLVSMVETYGTAALLGHLAKVRGNESDESTCATLFSTVHKAKGSEFPTVRLCDDFAICPRTAEERRARGWNPEEGNLLYIAVTRAQNKLDISRCAAARDVYTPSIGDDDDPFADWPTAVASR